MHVIERRVLGSFVRKFTLYEYELLRGRCRINGSDLHLSRARKTAPITRQSDMSAIAAILARNVLSRACVFDSLLKRQQFVSTIDGGGDDADGAALGQKIEAGISKRKGS